jgi:methyl-accepting chemotaxis protein
VKKVSKQVSLIADGHILDKQNNIKSNNNDLGNISISINRLNVNLKNIVWNTQNDMEEIIKDAKVMKNDNNELYKNIEDSKRVCRSTNNDLNELNQMIKDNVNSANNLKEKARKAINTATEGQDIVNRTMDSINNIDTFSKKISEIISVMDNIAFQTNLLSLNAAVESARSGEHGKGFSVLSAEIRSLAQRSKKAAKQISELIHTSGEKIDETVKLSNSSTKVYYQIFNDLKSVTSQIEEFATRNKNQENGMDSIFHSIEDMVTTNVKNIELSDKIKSKNDMILSKSESILKVLKYFTISKNPEEELQIKLKKEEDNKNTIENLDKKDTESKQKKKNKKHNEKSDSDEYYDENTQLLVEKPKEEEENNNENDKDDEEYIEEFIIDDNIITDENIVEDIIQPIDDNKNDQE